MRSEATKGLALFDLDGTLIPWDTQLLFYRDVVREHRWRMLLLFPFFLCLPFAWIMGDGRMKRLFLCYLLGMRREEVEKQAAMFVEKTVMPLLYGDVLNMLEKHRENGDCCILTTASPDIYASIIAEKLRFEHVFSTDVLYGQRMGFYPRLPHGNNKGQVKVERLMEAGFLEKEREVIAYSDSSADLPMLRMASRRVLVNPSSKLIDSLGDEAALVVRPARPWKTRLDKLAYVGCFLLGVRKC